MRSWFSHLAGRVAAGAAVALSCFCALPPVADASQPPPGPRIELPQGTIEGTRAQIGSTQLQVFRGVPYAAAPIGDFRWREPQPLARWADVRGATDFGPRCMQLTSYPTAFRSQRMSEDCLYLNVWTPARDGNEKLPVLVYFHGGGFDAGDGSEGRYDGARLAARGIVSVTVNYRLGVFGFLGLPESASESPHGAAGNYGLLDQLAALRWVRENVARFGGDPEQVTIAGESAGAISVNAHMASPLSRGLFARAIGESGGAFSPTRLWHRSEAEEAARQFVEHVGATSLHQLRAMSADRLLAATGPADTPSFRFWPSIDGYFLADTPESSFDSGAQAPVPLLVGTNSLESDPAMVLAGQAPTPEVWRKTIKTLFRAHAGEALSYYPGNDEGEVLRSARALAGNLFVTHSTWRWMDGHRRTGQAPVYFYEYTHSRPPLAGSAQSAQPSSGARHGDEIDYALSNLDNDSRYAWKAEDHSVSRVFSGYVEQFVKTGDPNGEALPEWPAAREERDGLLRQVIGTQTHTTRDHSAVQQAFMQQFFKERASDSES